MVEICVTKVFQFLALAGLTPGPKFTKRGDDLLDCEVYHLQNFIALRQPTPEISLTRNPADTHTHTHKNKKTNSNRYIHNMPIGMCG